MPLVERTRETRVEVTACAAVGTRSWRVKVVPGRVLKGERDKSEKDETNSMYYWHAQVHHLEENVLERSELSKAS